jgi:hypothetical protein
MPPKGGPGGDADMEILTAVKKISDVLKKIAAKKDGTQPYIDRMMAAAKDMIVDVLKKDPKDLDASASAPAGDGAPPPPPAGAPPAPPTGDGGGVPA